MLNNLADAVCNPDWWIVATSFLGIIASLAISILLYKTTRKIGEQQNRIQREQLLISNFNLYRDIHRDLYNLKIYSNVVLPRIYDYLASNANLIEKKNLEKLETDFENMTCKVEIDEADYLLRFGENEIIQELKSYSDLISIIVGIVTAFKSKKPNTYTFEEKLRIRSLNPTDKQWLIEIEKKCDSKKIISILKFFIEEKYRLFEGENNVLKNIQTAYRDCEYANNNLSENKLR